MEQYIVSARKYRPATFRSVIGQNSLTTTLKNAIITRHLAHAYLFCGPRGVGKTTCARIFAKTINCSNITEEGEACNKCESCVSFNENRSLNIFEMDAASNNSVDDIRELVKQVMVPPQIGRYRVYIIDEVHMLSTAAFNAFLKTLEEPPEYAIFILATTEKHKILPTIISRCQVYDFNRIQINDTVDYLKYVAQNEKIDVETEALEVMAQKADGAMRDALSIFDQIVSYCGNKITYKEVIDILNVLDYEYYLQMVDCFVRGDVVGSLMILDKIINKGFDVQSFVSGLSSHFRDLLVAQNERSISLLQVSDSIKKRYAEQAKICPPDFLYKALELSVQCELNYKTSKNKRLLVELMLIKICQIISASEKKNNDSVGIKKIEPQHADKHIVTPSADNKGNVAAQQPTHTEQQTKTAKIKPQATNSSILNLSSILSDKKPDEKKNTQTIQNQPSTHKTDTAKDFTDEQLKEQWLRYADKVSDRAFFSKYVSETIPQKDGTNCTISVISEQQFKEFTDNRHDIERFLSQNLGNDVKLFINKTEIEHNKVISPDNILKDMIARNESMQELVDRMNLKINY